MANSQFELDDFPKLREWYESQSRDHVEPVGLLMTHVCRALEGAPDERVHIWLSIIDRSAHAPEAFRDDWLKAEALLSELEFPLHEVQAQIIEHAVRSDMGPRALDILRRAADATRLTAFRFLSAWTALNCDQPQVCVDECEKVEHPFSPILTLQGQALMETGAVAEAVNVLSAAAEMNPRELLAWFQLAKACLMLKKKDTAWRAVSECMRIAPGQSEIALLAALICLIDVPIADQCQQAWNSLYPFLKDFGNHEDVVLSLLKIAINLDDQQKALLIAPRADWISLKANVRFIRGLSTILHRFNEKNWYTAAETILSGLTADRL